MQINSTKFIYNIKNVTKERTGDSITIIVYGKSADSTSSLVLKFEKVIKMKPQKYECGIDFSTGTTISASLSTDTGEYFSGFSGGTGEINVLQYDSTVIAGSFDLTPAALFDTSKTLQVKGDFYAIFDLNSIIRDIDIPAGNMQARINNKLVYFDAIGAIVNFGVDTIINITGTYKSAKSDKSYESVVLQFVNLKPLPGDVITMSPEAYADNKYIKGSYIPADTIQYTADGTNNTTGKFTVVKISGTYIQGKFEFQGNQVDDTINKINVVEGKFNVRFNKSYNK